MRVTVTVPDPVGAEAEKVAEEEGVSVSALYARAVERFIEERRRERAIQAIDAVIGTSTVQCDAAEQIEEDREASDRART